MNEYGVPDEYEALLDRTDLKFVGPPAAWHWSDDETLVQAKKGPLMITPEMWEKCPTDVKERYRLVHQRNGLRGMGIVIEDVFFLGLYSEGTSLAGYELTVFEAALSEFRRTQMSIALVFVIGIGVGVLLVVGLLSVAALWWR